MSLLSKLVNNTDIKIIAIIFLMYFIHEFFKFATILIVVFKKNLSENKLNAITKIMSFKFDFNK